MLKTYARYTYTMDYTAKRVGNGWHEVTKEYMKYYPSGRQLTIVIDALQSKQDIARSCKSLCGERCPCAGDTCLNYDTHGSVDKKIRKNQL